MTIEKLKKVIDMAKLGASEGERANAKRIAEKACAELGIKYEDAAAGRFGKHAPFQSGGAGGDPFHYWTYEYTTNDFYYAASEMYRERERMQREAEEMSDMFTRMYQEQQEKERKRAAQYTDKFGEKWAGCA